MRPIAVTMLLMLFLIPLFSQEKKDVYKLAETVLFDDTDLIIDETDLCCTYFITNKIPKDICITGSEDMDITKIAYIDGDKMFIDKGSKNGLRENDLFMVISEGDKVYHPQKHKKVGIYFLKKGIAEITCIYDNTAIITLKKICNPVEIGDFLLPYREEEQIRKKKINYQKCRLPQAGIHGSVIHTSIYLGVTRWLSAIGDYVTIDIGNAYVSRGDFVVFYRVFQKKLPPLIIGTGVVVNPEKNNATVKVLDTSYPLEPGMNVVTIPEERVKQVLPRDEKLPILETLEDEAEIAETGELQETLEANILFKLDERTVDEQKYEQDFNRIKEFIAQKSKFVIILRGYACSIGGLEYNLKLSQDRVEFIKGVLLNKLGIEEKFFEVYYYGEKDALYDNTLEEQRRKNRLVNIQVIGK